jgi:hypothetical protein
MHARTSDKFAASVFRVDDKIARGMLGIEKYKLVFVELQSLTPQNAKALSCFGNLKGRHSTFLQRIPAHHMTTSHNVQALIHGVFN